jgi:hypothetical protein
MTSDDYDDEDNKDSIGCAWMLEILFVIVVVVAVVIILLCSGGC